MQTIQEKSQVEEFKRHMEIMLAQITSQHRSESVKRGLKSMVLLGYLPAPPPIGYERTMRKGLYKPTKLGNAISIILRKLANDRITVDEAMSQLKLVIEVKTHRKMTADKLVRLMGNPYYAGMLCCQGKQYVGNHVALLNTEQHKAILQALRNITEVSKGN